MGTIRVSEFVSLDGRIGAPTFTFGYPFTNEQVAATTALTDGGSTAILLGRTTFVETGPAWASRPDSEPAATFFNQSPKHVVSSTLTDPDWNNSSILGDVRERCAAPGLPAGRRLTGRLAAAV